MSKNVLYYLYQTEEGVNMSGEKMCQTMKLSYDKLWKLLIDRKMKKKDLQSMTKLSSAVIAKLGKNQPVHLSTLMKICEVLGCTLYDIIELKSPIKAK